LPACIGVREGYYWRLLSKSGNEENFITGCCLRSLSPDLLKKKGRVVGFLIPTTRDDQKERQRISLNPRGCHQRSAGWVNKCAVGLPGGAFPRGEG